MRALGLMSGTSMDGIDLALLDTDGEARVAFGPTGFVPYDETDRDVLRRALASAVGLDCREDRPPALAEAEALVTRRHVDAVRDFVARHGGESGAIDVVGFHGQTVLHRPERGLTIQIGDGVELARHCGIDVVADLRAADMAGGGQGAPIVPIYHRALALSAGLPRPAILLNIGGVANITVLPEGDDDPIACDTGPGNALIDDLMRERTGVAVDRDGATAARGQVDATALARLLDHPFFALPAPKSLDRNAWSRAPVETLSTEDAAATLTAFTAQSIALTIDHSTVAPKIVVVCGGGVRNPTLMRELERRLPCPVRPAEAFGWSADAMEAQAFAYLAVRSRQGLPLTFPTTTGVARPVSGGVFFAAGSGSAMADGR